MFASSRYVFDAIMAVTANGDADRRGGRLVDVDCVWLDAGKVFAAAPPRPGVGCIHIPYPLDWELYGFTPRSMAELAGRMGAPEGPVRWVGGELLTGSAGALRALVGECEALERELVEHGEVLRTEEQLRRSPRLSKWRHSTTSPASRSGSGPARATALPP